MKPVAYFFTVMLLFLNLQPILVNCQGLVKPGGTLSCPPVKSTCQKTANSCSMSKKKTCPKSRSENPKNKDCDRTAGCNPFASCSQCHYIVTNRSLYLNSIILLTKVRLSSLNEDIQAGFLADCWHPPEFTFT